MLTNLSLISTNIPWWETSKVFRAARARNKNFKMLYVSQKCYANITFLSSHMCHLKKIFFTKQTLKISREIPWFNIRHASRTMSQIFAKQDSRFLRTFSALSRNCRPIISFGKVIFHVPAAFHYSFPLSRRAFKLRDDYIAANDRCLETFSDTCARCIILSKYLD